MSSEEALTDREFSELLRDIEASGDWKAEAAARKLREEICRLRMVVDEAGDNERYLCLVLMTIAHWERHGKDPNDAVAYARRRLHEWYRPDPEYGLVGYA